MEKIIQRGVAGIKSIILAVVLLMCAGCTTVFNYDKTNTTAADPTTTEEARATTEETTAEETTEATTEEPDPRANYPDEYRDILIDAESSLINYSGVYNVTQTNLDFINGCNIAHNKFSEFLAEKRESLHLDNLSDLDREIIEMMLKEARYGTLNPKEHEIKSIVATGFNSDGSANDDNRVEYGNDNYWYGRCIYMNDDVYVYYHIDYVVFEGHGSTKDDVIGMEFAFDFKNDDHVKNFVKIYDFERDGMVTPDNVTETFVDWLSPQYRTVDFEMSDDLKELLYVYGLYATEIGNPKELAKKKEENARKEAEEEAAAAKRKNSSKSSSGSSSGRRKTENQKIDPDDLDIEGYYNDYRSDFENEDDAWDDLMDDEDLWDDY